MQARTAAKLEYVSDPDREECGFRGGAGEQKAMELGTLVASPAGVRIAAAVGLLLVYRYASAAEFPPAATAPDAIHLYMPVGPLALQV